MAATLWADRIQMTVSGTPGTGDITLGSATTGYRSFADGNFSTGDPVSYLIVDGNDWETGYGTYNETGPVLERDSGATLQSSTGVALDLTSSAIVSCVLLSKDMIWGGGGYSGTTPFAINMQIANLDVAGDDNFIRFSNGVQPTLASGKSALWWISGGWLALKTAAMSNACYFVVGDSGALDERKFYFPDRTGNIQVEQFGVAQTGSTVTPDLDYDGNVVPATYTGAAGTLTIANPSVTTPVNGEELTFRIKTTNAQTLSFGSAYRGCTDLALPGSTSGSSKTDYLFFKYHSGDAKWDLINKKFGF